MRKPDSLLELSVHASCTSASETAMAVSEEGDLAKVDGDDTAAVSEPPKLERTVMLAGGTAIFSSTVVPERSSGPGRGPSTIRVGVPSLSLELASIVSRLVMPSYSALRMFTSSTRLAVETEGGVS